MANEGVKDLWSAKQWAIQLSSDVSITILRVDQVNFELWKKKHDKHFELCQRWHTKLFFFFFDSVNLWFVLWNSSVHKFIYMYF